MRLEMKPIVCLFVPFAAGIVVAAAISFPVISAQPGNTKLEIDNFSFSPQRITVKPGTTVTWTNEDDTPHTVASTTKMFKSKALDTNDGFAFTFTTPGVYEYFCSLHPYMTGTIVVEGASGSSAAQ
jgi:plastocyanin